MYTQTWPSKYFFLHLFPTAPSHLDSLYPSPRTSLKLSAYFTILSSLSALYLLKTALLPQNFPMPPDPHFLVSPHFVGPSSGVVKETIEEAEE